MANIKVISVGGGGMSALNHMIESGLTGAEFISCAFDRFYLEMSKADKKILIGKNILRGLDGSTTARSKQAAIDSREEILETLRGADAVIIVAGLGGFDGTGASPVVASYAKELGALTVAVASFPFRFEGIKRTERAKTALKNLSEQADTVIKIPNDTLLKLVPPKTPMTYAFKIVDKAMLQAVRSLIATFQAPFKIDINAA